MVKSCLDENALAEFLCGVLSVKETATLEHHMDTCPKCRSLLSILIRTVDRDGCEDSNTYHRDSCLEEH